MTRTPLTDGTGRWFDSDAAEAFEEDTRWDGNNHISLATGSQWEHETLFRTAGGQWVLHSYSQWQGPTPVWAGIDNESAARWLSINSHEPHKDCSDEYTALQIT